MDASGGGGTASAVPTAAKEKDPTCFGGGGSGGLERASATALSLPATWRMSVVYSAMSARCRCCHGVHGGDVRVRAVHRGLWSVQS